MIGRELLRRGTEDLFKLTTEMSFGCKPRLSGSGLAGIALSDQLFGHPALDRPHPMRGRASHVLLDEALQVPL